MKEKNKKILSILMITTILFSVFATLLPQKAKAATLIDSNVNITDWLDVYAQIGASSPNNFDKDEWIKENGFNINTIENQKEYVLNFEKATDEFKSFNRNVRIDGDGKEIPVYIELDDVIGMQYWLNIFKGMTLGTIDTNNNLIKSFKQMGMNTENIKLVADAFADEKEYVVNSSDSGKYTKSELNEIFYGDIIKSGTTIKFTNESGVSANIPFDNYTEIKEIKIGEENTFNVTFKDGTNEDFTTSIINFYDAGAYQGEGAVETSNVEIYDENNNVLALFGNSQAKKQISQIYYFEDEWVIDYASMGPMDDCDRLTFQVVDGNNETWTLVLATDWKLYLVNENAFKDDFNTTLSYSAIINTKDVGGKEENGVFLPNYDANDIEKDANVIATIKSTNDDNIITVNGKALDTTGKPNEEGWYYANTSDKTTISKEYPFNEFNNLTNNGMVTETVELGNEDKLISKQKVSIKWPFRIIKQTQEPEDIDENTDKVRVEITTNLPMDAEKLPKDWKFTTDDEGKTQHRIYKEYLLNNGNVDEDVVVKANGRDDTDSTNVTIKWKEKSPAAGDVKAGEKAGIILAIVFVIGIAVISRIRYRKINKK